MDHFPTVRMRRRDFLRASAMGSAAAVAAVKMPAAPASAAQAGASGSAGSAGSHHHAPYVGAGSSTQVRPFQLYDVRLGQGLLKEKQDRMLNFARAFDHNRFLRGFQETAHRPLPSPVPPRPGGWENTTLLRGHWTGHFITLLAQSHAATGEQIFQDKLDEMVEELGACQDDLAARIGQEPPEPQPGQQWFEQWFEPSYPGYLSAYPEDVVLRLGPPRFAVYGGNTNTNTWAPWYTLHKIMRGFLDAYTLTGNERAFDIVVKMAAWAHHALTVGDLNHPNYPGPITRDDLNFMWDLYIAGEFGGANEVFPELYALTGDAAHLEAAKLFDHREGLLQASAQDIDILTVANPREWGRRRPARLHANTHVPSFTGYLRIFEQDGDEEYYLAAKNFFGMVVPHRMYVHGGTSGNYLGSNNNIEMFQNRGNIAYSIASHSNSGGAETCTTYNLLKLARNLFFHDPDPAYIDYYERGLYNQIAGSRADNNVTTNPQVTYFQPLTPGAQKGGFGNSGTCCGGTGLENHTKYQEAIYFRSADDSTLWVNLYAASTLEWQEAGFTVTQVTDFPREQGTTLHVNGSGPLALKLRVPGWAQKGFSVKVNGVDQQVVATPSSYVTISREWQPGDTVEVSIPFSVRIERALDRPDTQAIFWGPLLMPILGNPPGFRAYRELTLYRYLKRDGDYSREAITPVDETNFLFTTHGFTLQPWYVGARPAQSPYFRRVEPEIVFGSISTGVTNYKRNDGLPDFDLPVGDAPSPPEDGPTFLDLLWDQAPFANHGEFVSKVTRLSEEFVAAGMMSEAEKDRVVSRAAQSERELTP